MRDLEAISGPVWRSPWEGHSEAILDLILDPIWTLSEKPHQNDGYCLHLAVGRVLRLNMVKCRVLGLVW